MIKYNLLCKCGENFESWFSSSREFDSLCKKKLVKCIYCESSSVKKNVMAPNLASRSNKKIANSGINKNIKKQLLQIRKYLEKNFKDVGENFPHEARSIHYDKKKGIQGIYGKATPEEASELQEEGIEVETIPWVDKSEN
mgnify:CR=1 FL=1|jgi:hypothetical protein|tara:strand:- start:1404 stop:1823 length:420 start_codon:yes stop_codon:yes gene_type:complete